MIRNCLIATGFRIELSSKRNKAIYKGSQYCYHIEIYFEIRQMR